MGVRELGPASLRVVQAVDATLAGKDLTVLVACSGGPDSLALAAAVSYLAPRRGWAAVGIVVDHGLQPDSAEVAQKTVAVLAGLGLAARCVGVAISSASPEGPEAAARNARYAALEAAAAEMGAATVLLGHTRDDQAETVLLGLARGSGARSLAGMPVRAGRRVRPLLGLPRSDCRQACREWGLVPWTDPHNADPRYARARVRSRVLPMLEAELGPGVAVALARTADLLRADADLLDTLAEQADSGEDELDCPALAALPLALRRRVLRRWLRRVGVSVPTREQVCAVEALVVDWHGQRGVDLPGRRIRRTRPTQSQPTQSRPTQSRPTQSRPTQSRPAQSTQPVGPTRPTAGPAEDRLVALPRGGDGPGWRPA